MRRIAMVCLVLVMACGGGDGSTAPAAAQGVSGVWRGTMADGTPVLFSLNDQRGVIVGTAVLRDGAAAMGLTVTGESNPPDLTLALALGSYATVVVNATVSGNAMAARLNGSGFNRDTVTLRR